MIDLRWVEATDLAITITKPGSSDVAVLRYATVTDLLSTHFVFWIVRDTTTNELRLISVGHEPVHTIHFAEGTSLDHIQSIGDSLYRMEGMQRLLPHVYADQQSHLHDALRYGLAVYKPIAVVAPKIT